MNSEYLLLRVNLPVIWTLRCMKDPVSLMRFAKPTMRIILNMSRLKVMWLPIKFLAMFVATIQNLKLA